MLIRKISPHQNLHARTLLDGYVHIPVAAKVNAAFFNLLQKTSGSFIHGHFVQTDDDLRSDILNFDFILIRSEMLNGESCCGQLSLFNLYIIESVYYKKINLPDQFTLHFILNVAKESTSENKILIVNESVKRHPNTHQEGNLYSAIIPEVLL